ncbi:MAG: hypothetical protein WBB28_03835 [Crinalium sp.]
MIIVGLKISISVNPPLRFTRHYAHIGCDRLMANCRQISNATTLLPPLIIDH